MWLASRKDGAQHWDIKTDRSRVAAAALKTLKRAGPGRAASPFIVSQFLLQIDANNRAAAHAVVVFDRNTEAVIDPILTFEAVCVLSLSAKRPTRIDLVIPR